MTTVLLIVHLFVTLALIGVVLIQRSEGGGLGVGTSQGMGGFMSGRGTANLLTRTTAVLATIFFVLSMGLALLNRGTTVGGRATDILDRPPTRTAPALPRSPALSPNPNPTPSAPPDSALVPPATPPDVAPGAASGAASGAAPPDASATAPAAPGAAVAPLPDASPPPSPATGGPDNGEAGQH